MTYVCSNCLFCEAVRDEDYSACQLRQALVMPYDKVCDFFELNRRSFKEIDKVTMDLNGVNEYTNDLQDEYTNSTELPKVKILRQEEDDIIEYASMEGLCEAIEELEGEYEDDTSPRKPDFFGYTTTTPCDCDYCNCNSYPKEQDPVEMVSDDIDFMMEDIRADTDILLEKMTLLSSKEASPRKVLKAVLGLEVDIALLKQLLLEIEELNDSR